MTQLKRRKKWSVESHLIYLDKVTCWNKHRISLSEHADIRYSSVQPEGLFGGMHGGSSLLGLSPLFGHDLPDRWQIPGDASLSQHLHKDEKLVFPRAMPHFKTLLLQRIQLKIQGHIKVRPKNTEYFIKVYN